MFKLVESLSIKCLQNGFIFIVRGWLWNKQPFSTSCSRLIQPIINNQLVFILAPIRDFFVLIPFSTMYINQYPIYLNK